MKKIVLVLVAILGLFFYQEAYCQDITIVYTGSTHAALLPCHCPMASNGGIARRHTKLKELRRDNPNLLLLDSGSIFAGGKLDTSNKSDDLNKERTKIYLQALGIMKYDAIGIGDEEFNFGDDFLFCAKEKYNIPFISSNISATNRGGPASPQNVGEPSKSHGGNISGGESDKILPFIIKKIGKAKIGILALTDPVPKPNSKLEFSQPMEAIKKTVAALKKENPDLIILLSQLDDTSTRKLIKETGDINLIISGQYGSGKDLVEKIDSTILAYPRWEARSLGRLNLKLKNSKIVDYKFTEIPLDNKIKDSPEMLSLLPECLGDLDCRKAGFIGKCENIGKKNSRCVYTKAKDTPLTIIRPKDCSTCDIPKVVLYLKNNFPGIKVTYLDDASARANELIKELDIRMLPAYILDKGVEKEANFKQLSQVMDLKNNYYILRPAFTGVSFFLGRPQMKGTLDIFVGLNQKDIYKFLEALKSFEQKHKEVKTSLHFFAFLDENNQFKNPGGAFETEEYLRALCVRKYYPENFWDYLICRAKDINTSWWDDCAVNFNIDPAKIKSCARSEEGRGLLKENIDLVGELNIYSLPSILLDNQEIVTGSSETSLEELERLIRK
ncbi:MAG: hypothetical protein V1674_02860 [Candidatus Omnitrophota bacterium]